MSNKKTIHNFFAPIKTKKAKTKENKNGTKKVSGADFFKPRNTQKKNLENQSSSIADNKTIKKNNTSSTVFKTTKTNTTEEKVESSNSSKVDNSKSSILFHNIESYKDENHEKSALDDDTYDPILDAPFKQHEPVPYSFIVDLFEKCEVTPGRLDMIQYTSNYLRTVLLLNPNDLLASMYLCVNKIAPAFKGMELGIGDSMLISAIAEVSGTSKKYIQDELKEHGDLGDIAHAYIGKSKKGFFSKPKPLTVIQIFETFRKIATTSGKNSNNKKKFNKKVIRLSY